MLNPKLRPSMAGSIARNGDIVWKVALGRSAIEVLVCAPMAN